MQQPQSDQLALIETGQLPLEFVMNQLRLRKGFSLEYYSAITGLAADTLQPGLNRCLEQNLLEYSNGDYRCSEQGWNFLDSILEQFISS